MRNMVIALCLMLSAGTVQAATLTTLVSFAGSSGEKPIGGLSTDAAGNFYGTTFAGGANGTGTVFKFDNTGVLTTLASFSGKATDSGLPIAGVIADAAGNFYGTSYYGGEKGLGTVYKLDKFGKLTKLVDFNRLNGAAPQAGLIVDAVGNLYGTTSDGGTSNKGTVFKISTTGALTTLVSFDGTNGGFPAAGLILDSAGNLFGTSAAGTSGAGGYGTVFKLAPTGVLTTLGSFNDANGRAPNGLIADAAGNFYGTTGGGGTSGAGTIFKLDTAGALTTLASFAVSNGLEPMAGLTTDAAGNLYGTTSRGGANNGGTVFELDKTGMLTTLVDFNGSNGQTPYGGLIADAAGNLYGTTVYGGANNTGTLFKISFGTVAGSVPEPATWALMLTGFGMTGAAVRRRSARAVAA